MTKPFIPLSQSLLKLYVSVYIIILFFFVSFGLTFFVLFSCFANKLMVAVCWKILFNYFISSFASLYFFLLASLKFYSKFIVQRSMKLCSKSDKVQSNHTVTHSLINFANCTVILSLIRSEMKGQLNRISYNLKNLIISNECGHMAALKVYEF